MHYTDEYVNEQIIQNGIPVKQMDYHKIKQNGKTLLVEGHTNNHAFRYINPHGFRKKNTKSIHFKNENSPEFSMKMERMPTLVDSIQLYYRKNNKKSKKRRKSSRKTMKQKSKK